jgi:hypothetical protein
MRVALLLACLTVASGCDRGSNTQTAGSAEPATASSRSQSPDVHFPVKVDGTGFVDSAGRPFRWSGITAFRLLEMMARGREREAVAYLDWAASEQLTVVRVLTMAKHLFELRPEDGRNALPRLLDLARERGLAVEVVALADTKEYAFDLEGHVRHVGRISLEKGNAFVEIANEPGHPTQNPRLHDPMEVRRLATLVPPPVVMAFGSAEYAPGYAAGDYATFHFPREAGWGHVVGLARGASLITDWKKPVINDEPIGAAAEYQEGRRDNVPERFAAAAALTTLAGMGGTFHYEGGLQGRIPQGREAACLAAWQMASALVSNAAPAGEFVEGTQVDRVARITGGRAVFARISDTAATILVVDPQQPAVTWTAGWVEERRAGVPGVLILSGRKAS